MSTTRNRIIYQSEALVMSPISGAATGTNIIKLIEANASTEVTRKNVNVFGKAASIDRIIVDEPQVSVDFKYYLTDGENEAHLGFPIDGSTNILSNFLQNSGDVKNFFMVTSPEGVDAHNTNPNTGTYQYVNIGNAFINRYGIDLKVGDIPTASISAEASNIVFATGSSSGVRNPSVDISQTIPTQLTGNIVMPTINVTGDGAVSALRPGDIVLDFGSSSLDMGGAVMIGSTSASSKTSCHIDSFSLEVPIKRQPLKRIGNFFAFAKVVDLPIDVTLTASANLADIDAGSLIDLICAGSVKRTITATLYGPCDAGVGAPKMFFKMKGAILDSEAFKASIGQNKTVDFKFSAQVGAPNDTDNGIFVSGSYT